MTTTLPLTKERLQPMITGLNSNLNSLHLISFQGSTQKYLKEKRQRLREILTMQQLVKKTNNGNGIPPCYPRSSSQPDFVFSFDSLPPLSPGEMPRGKILHRRSHSEISSGLGEDLFREFASFDRLDAMGDSFDNNSGSSENEAESTGGVRARHCRSGSMDSFIMEKTNSIASNLDLSTAGEFSSAELEKILANEMLAKIALADPKRVKRILANRLSAARSKQRKMQYISELERKVQTLQAEATTLSAQLTMLQKNSAGISSQNNEFKIRLQAMEQQAQLKDALNESLTAEVHRLKFANAEVEGIRLSNSSSQKISINPLHMFQLKQQQQQQHHQNSAVTKNESN